jgi:hypothetical protein
MEAPADLDFPRDYMPLASGIFGKPGLLWLRKYGIDDKTIEEYKIGWSQERFMLIFPVFDSQGNLVMWQGRNFRDSGGKYLTKGPKSDIMYLTGNPYEKDILVVTEDFISALKVGVIYQSMPLWGSTMSLGLIKKVASRFSQLGVWLDRDKAKESVEIALRASQYLPTFVVESTFDPKDYQAQVCAQMVLAGQSKNTIYQENNFEDPNWKEHQYDYGKSASGS